MKRRLRMGFCWFLVTIAICTALLLICNQLVINNADGRLFDEIETVPEGYSFGLLLGTTPQTRIGHRFSGKVPTNIVLENITIFRDRGGKSAFSVEKAIGNVREGAKTLPPVIRKLHICHFIVTGFRYTENEVRAGNKDSFRLFGVRCIHEETCE